MVAWQIWHAVSPRQDRGRMAQLNSHVMLDKTQTQRAVAGVDALPVLVCVSCALLLHIWRQICWGEALLVLSRVASALLVL